MNTTCLVLLIFSFLSLTGCREKVYWVPGELKTGGMVSLCERFPDGSQLIPIRKRLMHLIDKAQHLSKRDDFLKVADEISELVMKMKSYLDPEYTDSLYPVEYHFPLFSFQFSSQDHLRLVEFSIMGLSNLSDRIHIESGSDGQEIILRRKASLLEICSLRETVQGLYSVGSGDEFPSYYLRLYLKDVN